MPHGKLKQKQTQTSVENMCSLHHHWFFLSIVCSFFIYLFPSLPPGYLSSGSNHPFWINYAFLQSQPLSNDLLSILTIIPLQVALMLFVDSHNTVIGVLTFFHSFSFGFVKSYLLIRGCCFVSELEKFQTFPLWCQCWCNPKVLHQQL